MKSLLLAITTMASAHAGDFVSLFNGKDFTNWEGKGKTEMAGYVIKDGSITSTPKCNILKTKKEYSNYVLQFEFKLTANANNGLGIHYPGQGDPADTGMEIQILDNTGPVYSDPEHPKYYQLKDYQVHGSLYKLQGAKKGHLKPTGEWNKETVTVNGANIKVELNGVVIMEANLDELNKSKPEY